MAFLITLASERDGSNQALREQRLQMLSPPQLVLSLAPAGRSSTVVIQVSSCGRLRALHEIGCTRLSVGNSCKLIQICSLQDWFMPHLRMLRVMLRVSMKVMSMNS